MIGSSKNNGENYARKCFWTQEKETRVKCESAFEQLAPEQANNRIYLPSSLGTANASIKINPLNIMNEE